MPRAKASKPAAKKAKKSIVAKKAAVTRKPAPKSPPAKTGSVKTPTATSSRHFGLIAADTIDVQHAHAGETIRMDLNVKSPETLVQSEVDAVDRVVDELERHDASARAAFVALLNDSTDEVQQFWQFHHDEVEEHAGLQLDAFVPALQLVRVGFYPDGAFGASSFFVLDYALRGPSTDQLLVAKFGRDGSLLTIAWES